MVWTGYRKIQLNWKNIKCLHHFPAGENLDNILKCYPSVFQDGIGSVKDIKASLYLKPDTKPKFMKPRPVAYSLKPKVEVELDKLESKELFIKLIQVNGLHLLWRFLRRILQFESVEILRLHSIQHYKLINIHYLK